MDERGKIATLARMLGSSSSPTAGIEVGIGDDAAVLATSHAPAHLVWTIDEQVEGVHFRRTLASWHQVGWRSFMAAASDVAAMGAVPWCALSALVLSDDVDDEAFAEIVRGQGDAATAIAAPIVGGNLARGGAVSIATTLLGMCNRPVRRSGARAGNGLWLAGRLGLAAAGLKAIERSLAGTAALDTAAAAWRTPMALVREGSEMAAAASAAVDVSDGFARDAGHLAEASEVALVFDESALLADLVLIEAAEALGESALDLALYGGEDYAIVATSDVPLAGFRRIGDVCEGQGLRLRGANGVRAIEPRGFDHFAQRPARA